MRQTEKGLKEKGARRYFTTNRTCERHLVRTDVKETGTWQKCLEDNAGVEVDELKHGGGAGGKEQTQVLNVRRDK